LISVIWVDDMVGIVNTKETDSKFVQKLTGKYKIKVIGKLNIPECTSPMSSSNYKNHTI
jgi:hypothetical protein